MLCFGWSDGGAARRGAGECALRWFRRESAAPEEAELASGGDVLVVGWNDTDGGAVPVLYQAPGTGETGDGGVVLGVAGAAGLARSYWGGTAGNGQRFGAVQGTGMPGWEDDSYRAGSWRPGHSKVLCAKETTRADQKRGDEEEEKQWTLGGRAERRSNCS